MQDDDLEAARGVIYACLSSVVLWGLVVLCWYIAR